MFATNPAKLMVGLKVSQFFNSFPAALAGYARVPFFFTSFVFNLWNSGILFLLVKQEGFSIIVLFSA